ncbi:MAG: alpha-2-macroglobulin family protein [Gammaproteobacteria bacterium]
MIVKQAYAQAQTPGLPLEVIVSDPRGTTVLDQKMTLDATGYLSFDFHTNPTSPTGQYTINLFIVHDNQPGNLLGSTTLRVAEFLPDRMRIKTHLSHEEAQGWVSPTDLNAQVSLTNLYGAPATDRKISAKILLAPQRVEFSEYPQYSFVDPLFDPNKPAKVFTDTLPDVKTNDQGQAEIPLGLNRFDKATYKLTLFTEGFESEGGRSVTTQTSALVSPLSYFIGYKADGDLNYIKQDSQRTVNFIAINPQLKQQAVNNLRLQLASLQPVTTLVKNPDGSYQYQSIIQTSVISTTPFSVSEQGTNYELPAQQIGNYSVTILDQNNTELSRLKFSIVGNSQIPLPKNAELNVKLNKTEYSPNDEIELQITAPYTGAGLITIERDKVYATQWFKADTTSSIQKIRLPQDFQGNGYVNVTFVRDWNSPEIFINPLSYSIVPFSVNHENSAIHIDLTTPDIARPGEAFTIGYKSDKPGKIIVFAVDEGILQVANYKTPDPLGFFFQKRALQVLTQQTVDQILPKFIQERELSAAGGDGGVEELKSNLNPFKRKTDLPVIYWSGIVDTDSTPRQLVYQVPDYFNGSLRVMAVAVSDNAVGSADKTSVVRGDFVINPNVPTFVAPNDEFDISATVANNMKNSGANAAVKVQLTVTPELTIVGSAEQSLKINEGREQTVHFKVRAKSLLGSAQIVLTATSGDKSSKMASTLSVRPASAFATSVTSGNANVATQSLTLDRKLYPEYRNVTAVMSSSPLILVYGLQRYLENFPFGCTEQLVSKAMPLIAMGNQAWLNKNPREVSDKIEATIQAISQRQMSSGAFSYWPGLGENENNAFATVYAMHFLTEARHTYNVPNDVFRAGVGYLKDLAAEETTSLEQARIQAYAIYILTRNEMVTTNYLTHLQLYLGKDKTQVWHQDITSAYIAASYQLLKSYTDADKLINYYKPQGKEVGSSYDFYNSTIADAEYLYLIARHFPDKLPKVGDSLISPLVTAMNNDEINTVLSGYTSLALGAYAQISPTTNAAAFSISETLADGSQKTLDAQDTVYESVNVDALAKKINFNNPSKQNYFYQLTQAGFDKKLPTEAIKQGLEITREYRDAKGNVIDSATLGSEIEVHIQMRTLNDRSLSNIVIVDLLPGGFEVVRDSVNTTNMDYADVREDRVVFFGMANPEAKEIVYRIKAINTGKYTVPPILANSMYHPMVKAQSTGGNILVNE